MKKHKGLKLGVVAVLLLCCACWGYTADFYHANDAAVAAMSSAADVTVEQQGNTLAFIPENAETGLIFYPGGKVEYIVFSTLFKSDIPNYPVYLLSGIVDHA